VEDLFGVEILGGDVPGGPLVAAHISLDGIDGGQDIVNVAEGEQTLAPWGGRRRTQCPG